MDRMFLEHNFTILQQAYLSLTKNSDNSSLPPTSDSICKQEERKARNQSLREKSDRQSGGQLGHSGSTRRRSKPDKIIQYAPSHCPLCNKDLGDDSIQRSIEQTRQEVDLPEIKCTISDHQLLSTTCSCGCKAIGEFPKNINAPVQFGNNMKTAIVYYHIQNKLPINKIKQTLSELYGIDVSEGTIVSALQECASGSKTAYKEIMSNLKDGSRIGSDETGNHVNGKKIRVRTRQNNDFTYLTASKTRSYETVKENLGEDYDGVIVHDCFGAQNNSHASRHQLCLVHIERDCNYAIEIERSKRIYDIKKLLVKASKAQKRLRSDEDIREKHQQSIVKYYKTKFNELLQTYYEFYTKSKDPPKETTKLWKRLTKHKEKIFVFLECLDVPSHNNQSEGAIRNQKVHKKVSGGFRTMLGAGNYCQILSVIHSLGKQKKEIFGGVKKIFEGDFSWH